MYIKKFKKRPFIEIYQRNRYRNVKFLSNTFILFYTFIFFMTNLIVGKLYINNIRVNGVGVLSLVFLSYLLIRSFLFGIPKVKMLKPLFALIFFFIIVFVMANVYFLLEIPNTEFYKELYIFNIAFVLEFCALFMAAYNLNLHKIKSLILLCYLIMFVCILVFTDWDIGRFFYGNYIANPFIASYQAMGRSYILLGILALCIVRNKLTNTLILLSLLLGTFLIAARSEFLMAIIIMHLLVYKQYGKAVFFCLLLFFFMVVIFFVLQAHINEEIVHNRIMSLLKFQQDNSVIERAVLSDIGWSDILSNPFLGKYGGQVFYHGGIGGYMHNVFSVWRQFGVIPFCLYMYFMFYGLWFVIKRGTTINNIYMESAFFTIVPIVVLMFFAKSYNYVELAFPLGVICKLLSNDHLYNLDDFSNQRFNSVIPK